MAAILAPATTAPLGSVTRPVKVERNSCAESRHAKTTEKTARRDIDNLLNNVSKKLTGFATAVKLMILKILFKKSAHNVSALHAQIRSEAGFIRALAVLPPVKFRARY